MYSVKNLLFYLLLLVLVHRCFSIDSIDLNQSFKDGDVLISEGEVFELLFFSPGSSSNRYVGVRYHKIPEKNIVWVANRDDPLTNTSGVLSVDRKGQLVLFDSKNPQVIIWSSSITLSGDGNYSAKLLDTGNLVLFKDEYSEKNVVWQGFDHPTDTYLPLMKLKWNKKTGENKFITSWKSPDNPGTGEYSYKLDVNGSVPQLFIYHGETRLMRVGHWNGLTFTGYPEYIVGAAHAFSKLIYTDNEEEVSIYYILNTTSVTTRFVINQTKAVAERLTWEHNSVKWNNFWTGPKDQCDRYGQCGAFSYCDSGSVGEQSCKCLPGYRDKSEGPGCVRKPEALVCGNGEGFKAVYDVKSPDTATVHLDSDLDIQACRDLCLKNCACRGYMTANMSSGRGCLTWDDDLVDVRKFSDGGQPLYLRVDRNESGNSENHNNNQDVAQMICNLYKDLETKDPKKRVLRLLLLVVLLPVFAILLILVLAYWLLMKMKRRGLRDNRHLKPFGGPENSDISFMESYPNVLATNERGTSSGDLQCFSLATITAATNNFCFSKKIGEGGFGAVYKGQLHGGQDIAVKRLSNRSSQGIEEFRNEIILIAKLQHRNLVRLLGYCIQQEKMLIYEYLPNKGLDCFIFDKERESVLDWHTRFNIAMGIARGMTYLHHDSRLRIIHRDLKPSNVLLDASMNPKISDFGMARIFGSDQNEDTTKRVVGTYGYMSPEYAMEGLFSIKSDVFSFGVLLLEIISGRKNTSTFSAENTVNLIGHVWDRWLNGEPLDIVDPSLGESYEVSEVLRCINIGLLCVQESAAVRPTMSEVASMLCNERTPPSSPEQPAFVNRMTDYFGPVKSNSSSQAGATTVSDMTVTIVDGR